MATVKPVEYKPGDIVPSQQVPVRSRAAARVVDLGAGTEPVVTEPQVPCDCNPCVVGADGFVYCWDGNQVVLNDFPKTGGPWIPAVTNNGGVVWINGAGL